jgi:hypothetical protein
LKIFGQTIENLANSLNSLRAFKLFEDIWSNN